MRKAVQSERFPPDYSQRVYGHGGLLPRFLSHQRGTGNASPMYVYRWSVMRETLDKFRDWPGDPHEALLIEYVDPTTGGPVYKTITFFAQMLRPGERTLPLKQNASLVVRALRGHAATASSTARAWIGSRSTPSPCPAAAGASMSTSPTRMPAILFVASDEPTLKALAFYQKHGKTRPARSSARPERRRTRQSSVGPRHAERQEHQAACAYRLSRRRTGLGRGHHALYRPYAPAERHDASSTSPIPRNPASSAASRCRPAGIPTRCASPTTS